MSGVHEQAGVDKDIAFTAELAGEVCRRAGKPNRARLLFHIASQQWRGLGQEARAMACEAEVNEATPE